MAGRRLPSLRGLQAFETYVRTGSMVLAARDLGVTHGAVSRQIKALEQQLGARLLSGPRHGLLLTPAGQELAARLGAAFDLILAGLPGSDANEKLIISSPGTFAMKWLIPRLADFADNSADVHVQIIEDGGPADFSRGGIHAAIRLHRGPAPAGMTAMPFMDHAYGPVLAPALFDKVSRDGGRALHLPRLHSETFPDGWGRWASDAGVTLPVPSAERSFEHNSYMLEAAAAGLGVAVTAWAFAESDIGAGKLVAPWAFKQLPTRFTYLRPALVQHKSADRFAAWLKAAARAAAQPPSIRQGVAAEAVDLVFRTSLQGSP